jgi:hypothetical protein
MFMFMFIVMGMSASAPAPMAMTGSPRTGHASGGAALNPSKKASKLD